MQPILIDAEDIILILECQTNARPSALYLTIDSEMYSYTEQIMIDGQYISKVNLTNEEIESYELVTCTWDPYQQRITISENKTLLGKSIQVILITAIT